MERQTKSDRPSKCDCASHSASSYLENRFTFENQIWYTNKRVTLEHIETIFKTIFSPVDLHQRNHYIAFTAKREKVRPVQNGG